MYEVRKWHQTAHCHQNWSVFGLLSHYLCLQYTTYGCIAQLNLFRSILAYFQKKHTIYINISQTGRYRMKDLMKDQELHWWFQKCACRRGVRIHFRRTKIEWYDLVEIRHRNFIWRWRQYRHLSETVGVIYSVRTTITTPRTQFRRWPESFIFKSNISCIVNQWNFSCHCNCPQNQSNILLIFIEHLK